jgi:hypothetical protein
LTFRSLHGNSQALSCKGHFQGGCYVALLRNLSFEIGDFDKRFPPFNHEPEQVLDYVFENIKKQKEKS